MEEAFVEMYLAGVSVRRVEDITEALWGTKVSRSTVHFYRNGFSVVPKGKARQVAAMVHQDIQETLEYMNFPDEHWRHIRTNNPNKRAKESGHYPMLLLVARGFDLRFTSM